jgi:hypothetical protein
MKPRAYFCPCVEGPVPLDHWTSGSCTDHPMPLGWIIGITKDRAEDRVHCEGNITATRLTTCPRQVLIEDFVQPMPDHPDFGLVFDPRRMNSARFGQVVHKDIEVNTPPGGYKELQFPLEGKEPPLLDFGGGVTCRISGKVDYIHPNIVCMEDYKVHGESAHRFKWNKRAGDPETRSQFGIYKKLIEDSVEGADIKEAIIWHGAMTSAKHPAPPWFKVPVVPLSLEEIGEVRPFGARHSVREIIKMYQWATEQIGKIEKPRHTMEWYEEFNKIVNVLALVGETMFGGQKCLSYCGPAQPYCYALAGRVGVL